MAKQRSGKGGRVQWNGTNLVLKKWSVTEYGDDLDTTNFESGGVEEGKTGVTRVEFSFEGDWDAARNPFDSPPAIYPRDDGGPCKLYENVTDNVYWNFPVVRVLSATNSAEARGLVAFSASCKNNGTYTRPTGSV